MPFDADDHLDGLLLVCSDGRFEEHVDEFREYLRQSLGLRRLDRYFVPGSQLQFVSTEAGLPAADIATDYWAEFFINNHHLTHVVVVGHEHCAAYRSAPAYKGFPLDRLRHQQEEHLHHLRGLINQHHPRLQVHLFYMRPKDGGFGVDFFRLFPS
jgi:hypothetical protein